MWKTRKGPAPLHQGNDERLRSLSKVTHSERSDQLGSVGETAKKQLRSICGIGEKRMRCPLKETRAMNFRASRPCQHS